MNSYPEHLAGLRGPDFDDQDMLKKIGNVPQCSIHGVARCFLRAGVSVIPLSPNSKIPSIEWKNYQNAPMSEDLVNRVFNTSTGIGIITGKISKITVIDVDDPDRFDTFYSIEKLRAQTQTIVRTARGFHFWFRYEPQLASRSFPEFGFDTKSDGGFVVVPPTSINRHKYSFIKCGIPSAIPEELLQKILSLRMKQEYQRNENVNLEEVLRKLHSITMHTPQERKPGIWRTKCPAHDDREPSLDVEVLDGEINFKCWAGCRPEEILAALEMEDKKIKKTQINYKLITLEEVFQYPEVNYLVDEILPSGIVAVLGAYTGVGKSLVALSIIKAILTGGRLWGKYAVIKRGAVLLIDEETPSSFLKERVRKMQIEKNLPFYLLHFQGVRLDRDDFFKALMLRIEEVKPILVVIDSLIRVHRQREDEASSMSLVIDRLRQIANSGTTVLVIHHHRKAEGPLNQKLRGSSDIPGGVDLEYALIPKDEFLLFSSVKTRTKPITPIRLKIEANEREIEVLYHGEEGDEKSEILSEVLDILKDGGLVAKEIHKMLSERGFKIGINRLRDLLHQASEREEIFQEKGARGKIIYKLPPASQFYGPIYTREAVTVKKNEVSFTDPPLVSAGSREGQTLDNQEVEGSFTASRGGDREGENDVLDLTQEEVEIL